MLGYSILSRGILQCASRRPYFIKRCDFFVANFSTTFAKKSISKRPLQFLFASVPLTAVGAGYYFYKLKQIEEIPKGHKVLKEHTFLTSKPEVPISKTVKGVVDVGDIKLTLFQYASCPFCCKVRAFLDYHGLPYEIVEVDPISRKKTSWTTYKKVPILLAQVDGGYQQLNDSTMIISALKSYLMDVKRELTKIIKFYPIAEYEDVNGKKKEEIFNRYFLMYGDNLPKDKTNEVVLEEKQWREWADNSLVHTLSPNVYRTLDESMQTFTWFSEFGEWDKFLTTTEKNLTIYCGSLVMWIIGKRLKKKHQLKEDVRESLYDECRLWMKTISKKGTDFMGGKTPNLADLAVFGVLSSIEGCLAFQDLLKHTSIGKWYYPMKEAVKNHQGRHEIVH